MGSGCVVSDIAPILAPPTNLPPTVCPALAVSVPRQRHCSTGTLTKQSDPEAHASGTDRGCQYGPLHGIPLLAAGPRPQRAEGSVMRVLAGTAGPEVPYLPTREANRGRRRPGPDATHPGGGQADPGTGPARLADQLGVRFVRDARTG